MTTSAAVKPDAGKAVVGASVPIVAYTPYLPRVESSNTNVVFNNDASQFYIPDASTTKPGGQWYDNVALATVTEVDGNPTSLSVYFLCNSIVDLVFDPESIV